MIDNRELVVVLLPVEKSCHQLAETTHIGRWLAVKAAVGPLEALDVRLVPRLAVEK